MTIRACALLALGGLLAAADLAIEAPWSRATAPAAKAGAVFCAIAGGDADDRLVGAVCDQAETVELHTHAKGADGVMRMRPVTAIPVPAKGRTVLRPGAEHIMLIGLRAPLAEGSTVPVTLRFAAAGEITVQARVLSAAAMSAADAPAKPLVPTGCCRF